MITAGMRLYEYFFTISGVVGGYMVLMVGVTTVVRLISWFSKRFRYYIAPFSVVCTHFLIFNFNVHSHLSTATLHMYLG